MFQFLDKYDRLFKTDYTHQFIVQDQYLCIVSYKNISGVDDS